MRKLLVAAWLLAAMPAFGQEKSRAGESQLLDKPTCTSLDILFQLQPNRNVNFANVPTDPVLARIIMDRAGEVYWDEVTNKGKKSPGICNDKAHPYYIMTWTDIASTVVVKRNVPTSQTQTTVTGHVGDDKINATENSVTWQSVDVPVTDHSATVSIYVVDYEAGCVVFPPVFGTYKFNHNLEKATKKAMEEALQFLLRTGIQPAPKATICFQPSVIGIDADYVSKPPTSPESSVH